MENTAELKKLGRKELLELLLEASDENEKLRNENKKIKEKLSSKQINIESAGSIAEASLMISDVFAQAQQSADIYLENVKRVAQASREKQEEMTARAHREAARILKEAQEKATLMINDAKTKTERQWAEVKNKIDDYCKAQKELKEQFNIFETFKKND